MNSRELKNHLYEQVARIGAAVSSPKRLELLEILAQGEKPVEALAREAAIDIKLASAHLRVLKAAQLVQVRQDGKSRIYRVSGADVAALWVALRSVATGDLGAKQDGRNGGAFAVSADGRTVAVITAGGLSILRDP